MKLELYAKNVFKFSNVVMSDHTFFVNLQSNVDCTMQAYLRLAVLCLNKFILFCSQLSI